MRNRRRDIDREKPFWRDGKVWLITIALVIMPLGAILVALVTAGRLAARTRPATAADRAHVAAEPRGTGDVIARPGLCVCPFRWSG